MTHHPDPRPTTARAATRLALAGLALLALAAQATALPIDLGSRIDTPLGQVEADANDGISACADVAAPQLPVPPALPLPVAVPALPAPEAGTCIDATLDGASLDAEAHMGGTDVAAGAATPAAEPGPLASVVSFFEDLAATVKSWF